MRLDAVARAIFVRGDVDEIGIHGVAYLATRLLGRNRISVDIDERQHKPAVVLGPPWRIVVRSGLPRVELTLAIAWGVAEWWRVTQLPNLSADEVQDLALRLALPRTALAEIVGRMGPDLVSIGAEFGVAPDVVAHRLRQLEATQSGMRPRLEVAS